MDTLSHYLSSDKSLLAAYIFAPLAFMYVIGIISEIFSIASKTIHHGFSSAILCHEKVASKKRHSLIQERERLSFK